MPSPPSLNQRKTSTRDLTRFMISDDKIATGSVKRSGTYLCESVRRSTAREQEGWNETAPGSLVSPVSFRFKSCWPAPAGHGARRAPFLSSPLSLHFFPLFFPVPLTPLSKSPCRGEDSWVHLATGRVACVSRVERVAFSTPPPHATSPSPRTT